MRANCSNCPQKIQCELNKEDPLPRGICLTAGDLHWAGPNCQVLHYMYNSDIIIDTDGNLIKDRFGIIATNKKISLVVVTKDVARKYYPPHSNQKKRSKK